MVLILGVQKCFLTFSPTVSKSQLKICDRIVETYAVKSLCMCYEVSSIVFERGFPLFLIERCMFMLYYIARFCSGPNMYFNVYKNYMFRNILVNVKVVHV